MAGALTHGTSLIMVMDTTVTDGIITMLITGTTTVIIMETITLQEEGLLLTGKQPGVETIITILHPA